MYNIINGDTNTELALTEAECTAEVNLVTEIIFGDETLKLRNYGTRAFDVAGRADANCNFHSEKLLKMYFGIKEVYGIRFLCIRSDCRSYI